MWCSIFGICFWERLIEKMEASPPARRSLLEEPINIFLASPWDLDVTTSRRHNANMTDTRRTTVYFEPEIHRALKLKAASTDRSISEMVNEAVRHALAEDAEDLAAFEERAAEPEVGFESFVKALKRRGQI